MDLPGALGPFIMAPAIRRGGTDMTGDADDRAVAYMERTRRYYEAQGFERAYEWAHCEEVPFVRLPQPLAACTLALITTASPCERSLEDPRAVMSGRSAEFPDRLYTDDLAWDKDATHTRDLDSFFPIHHLAALTAEGRIGRLAERYHSVPTEYSQRRTRDHDAPEVLGYCREDGVDVALLVPL